MLNFKKIGKINPTATGMSFQTGNQLYIYISIRVFIQMQYDSLNLHKIKDVLYSEDKHTQIRNRMKLYSIAKVPVGNILSLYYPITASKGFALIPVKEDENIKLAYTIGLWANYRHPEILVTNKN
jgi:hypothetical protein